MLPLGLPSFFFIFIFVTMYDTENEKSKQTWCERQGYINFVKLKALIAKALIYCSLYAKKENGLFTNVEWTIIFSARFQRRKSVFFRKFVHYWTCETHS